VSELKRPLSDLGEKRIIREIIRPLTKSANVNIGVGDDAAIVDFPAGQQLVISCDKIPEDLLAIQLGLMDAFHHGRYLATVNISDVASMGAEPLGLLCTLALPSNFDVGYLELFMKGFVSGGAEWGVPIVGGDTGWGSVICVSATAYGSIMPGQALLRTGAKIGDKIFISGHVGTFGTALAYFVVARNRGFRINDDEENWLRDRLTRPTARVEVGRALSASGICTSCIDVTDGVGESLIEIAEASQAKLLINVASLPIHPITQKVANFLKCSATKIIFGLGLDLELLGTIQYKNIPLVTNLHIIGDVVEGGPGVVLDYGDRLEELLVGGWQHFKGSAMDFIHLMYG
jgi:thiamine-monophosphate kinase